MKKKILMLSIFVFCAFVSVLTVNAVSEKGLTLGNGTSMRGLMHDTIKGDFHTSIYTTSKSSGTIEIYNEVYRKNIIGKPKDAQNTTHYVKEVNKSYIFNSHYDSKAWTKSEWWIRTDNAYVTGNFYLVNGHDTAG